MRRIGSLFSGYGGLDIAAETFFDAITAWTCDIDPGASKILAHRYPNAPNLGDITAINWGQVEPVDILAGGWPCQPFSLAGKRKGQDDERALWPEVTRAVRTLRPQHIVLENVAAIATAGELGRATSDLAALGYVGQWRCLRAADVGAPHGRARIFIHAIDSDTAQQRRRTEGRDDGLRAQRLVTSSATDANGVDECAISARNRREKSESAARNGGNAVPHAKSNGRHERRPEPTGQLGGFDAAISGATLTDAEGAERRGTQPKHLGTPNGPATEPGERAGTSADAERRRCASEAANTGGIQRSKHQKERGEPESRRSPAHASDSGSVAWGVYEPAIRRWEDTLGRLAPPPTDTSSKGTQRLSSAFVEWMMGLPQGWVTNVPGLARNAQLKALGNGVVPQQAFAALQMMGEPA